MANVQLILLEDVENLGLAGEEVSVAPGYARNYLLPRGLAAKATPGVLRLLAARKEKIEARRREEKAAALALAAKVAELELQIPMQAASDDQLFGSVTSRVIVDRLAEAAGIKLDHTRVRIEAPIKVLGDFVVELKFHAEVLAPLKLKVVRND